MKKAIIAIALIVGMTASAQDMWSYAIQGLNTSGNFALPVATGDLTPYLAQPAGTWTVNLMDGGSVLGSTSVAAIVGGAFYITAWNTPLITELTSAHYEIVSGDGNAILASAAVVLQNADAPLGATDLNVDGTAFNFAGSSWQVIPEPATVGLFGLGALSAWFVRRNKRQVEA